MFMLLFSILWKWMGMDTIQHWEGTKKFNIPYKWEQNCLFGWTNLLTQLVFVLVLVFCIFLPLSHFTSGGSFVGRRALSTSSTEYYCPLCVVWGVKVILQHRCPLTLFAPGVAALDWGRAGNQSSGALPRLLCRMGLERRREHYNTRTLESLYRLNNLLVCVCV